MKRTWITIGIVVALMLAGGWGYWRYAGGQGLPGATGEATPAPPATGGEQDGLVWASGKLLPARWAVLSPATSGIVRSVSVTEGQRVTAGALLLELDNAVLSGQVAAATAAVAEAQAAQARLLAAAGPAEIAGAQADVSAAEGNLAAAQAALRQAQDAASAAEAQAGVAQAQHSELASRPSPAEQTAAARQIQLAQAALKQAQSAYDLVRGDPHIGSRPEALALEQATIAYDSARAAYDVAVQGATPEQLAVSQAQAGAAQAQVQVARSQAAVAEGNVQAAQGQLARAQAALQRLKDGATVEEKAAAEARVKSAHAGLAVAQAQLAQTQVIAPFDGQVGGVLVRAGELAVPGQPALMLGETGQMRVETTDLRETDITRLRIGLPVEITFDALPGRTFPGKIARIAPMSTLEKGSTNYTVVVELDALDPALRWGMTAFVNIAAGQ